MVASGDATTRNLADTTPEDRWYAINFHHEDSFSWVDYVANQSLAGNDRSFIAQLGLDAYQNLEEDAPKSSGLAGNLAMLIGLVAFSCKRRDLDTVLVSDRAWRGYRWYGHHRSHGRESIHDKCRTSCSANYFKGKEGRGIVVSVYRDPDNPEGSTKEALDNLEWSSGSLLK